MSVVIVAFFMIVYVRSLLSVDDEEYEFPVASIYRYTLKHYSIVIHNITCVKACTNMIFSFPFYG